MLPRTPLLLASLAGFTVIVAGTFGAHILNERLSPDLMHTFEVGVRYHAYHALALLALAGLAPRLGTPGRVAVVAFAVGIVIFAGTLYALALTGQRWLGAITPLGGLCFLVGWASLFVAAIRTRFDSDPTPRV